MKSYKIRRLVSLFSCFALILQTFLTPLLSFPVYAEDSIPNETIVKENPSVLEITPEVSQTPETTSPTTEIIQTTEITPTVEIKSTTFPTPEITPEIVSTNEPAQEKIINPTEEVTPTIEISNENSPIASAPSDIVIIPEPSTTPEITTEVAPNILSVSSETQNNSPPIENVTLDPVVTTDKEDYAPTDTVQITGMFFLANTPYTSTVTSETDN